MLKRRYEKIDKEADVPKGGSHYGLAKDLVVSALAADKAISNTQRAEWMDYVSRIGG